MLRKSWINTKAGEVEVNREFVIRICILFWLVIPISFAITTYEETSLVSIFRPKMVDNSFSLAVSDFIKEKIGDSTFHKDVMIVGDDYVVPGYRNEFAVDSIWVPFINKIDEYGIYTDQPYVTVEGLPQINELDLIFTQEGRVEDKQVMLIVPDSIPPDLRIGIDKLKNVIKTKFRTDDISEKKGSELIIGDYGIRGTTLVIIGNLENKISDSKDSPYLACCLATKADGIWSHDPHFLEQDKLRIFTNKNLLYMSRTSAL